MRLPGWCVGVTASLLCSVALGSAATAAGNSGTIGLVLTDWRYALHETQGKEECPAGLQPNEIVQFKAEKDHLAQLKRFGAVQNRGPNGENANHNPLAVEDLLPFNELKTKVGYGFNLDGTPDGNATANTCKHEKFTSAEGEQVDNQMARVMGCVQGWRTTGFMAEFISDEMKTQPINRILVEISGVDDEANDRDVEVAFYKGRDRLNRDANGAFIPFLSNRVDGRFPQFVSRTRGQIVDGVLTTDPIALARFPMYQLQIAGERRLNDARLRLKLRPDGADGFVGGYESIESWWDMHSKGPGVGTGVGAFSPAGLYRAALRYADGKLDPATGKCSALSVTYKISAVRALIVHGDKKPSGIAMMRE